MHTSRRHTHDPFLSSPPSSPGLCIDSSPLSSPQLEAMQVPFDAGRLADPFAGSFRATQTPPQYEKKTKRRGAIMTPPSTPPKRARFHQEDVDGEHHFDGSMPLPLYLQPSPRREKTAKDKEMEEWDRLDEEIFSQQMKVVDVSDRQVTFIPDHIIQTLKCLVCIPAPDDMVALEMTRTRAGSRPFLRSQTAPAYTPGFTRTFGERARSINTTSFHGMKDGIHFILSNNQITKLPRGIWDLERLTVLTLRGNRLTTLPPQISRLKNLEDLNVANNLLQYVPAELLSMNLRVLNVHPNPFLEPPSSEERPVGRTESLIPDRVLPLTELLYRILVSPAPSTLFSKGNSDSFLSAHYELPLPPTSLIPPRIADTLESCIPSSVCRSDLMAELSDDISMGVCHNPSHFAEGRIFVRPVEQRLSWEKVIGGQNAGGMVPVMWRGCTHGCLDFLQPDRMDLSATAESEDIEMEMDIDEEEDSAVQQISFGGDIGDFDFE